MGRSLPFARAKHMFSLVAAALALPNVATQQSVLAGIGPYISRGKGQGLPGNRRSRHRVAMDKRAALKARNRRRAR